MRRGIAEHHSGRRGISAGGGRPITSKFSTCIQCSDPVRVRGEHVNGLMSANEPISDMRSKLGANAANGLA